MEEIPGFREAVAREQLIRDAAFLPVREQVGPFEVEPMTLQHYLILRAARNPLLFDATPSPVDLAAFLWVLSPGYCQNPKARKKFLRRVSRELFPLFRSRKKRIEIAAKMISEAREYIRETFMDKPAARRLAPEENRVEEPDYYSDGCFLVARFGREYGWPPESTLNLKMKSIFQFVNEMRQNYNAQLSPKDRTPLFNPSEAIRMEWMSKQNRN